jgi:hypothetical protein
MTTLGDHNPPQPPAEVEPRSTAAVEPRSHAEGEHDEAPVGASDVGLATNKALRSLSRAARSFLLYDPQNEAIRTFLREYREAFHAALLHGALDLDVRPFELVREGEVVYLERDRDRSLAFRLFRDGVRRLSLRPGIPWEELLRLLEILSIRFTGVRQHEDDVVTLLWKAGFQHIEIAAVEGFVPDEEVDHSTAPATGERTERADTARYRHAGAHVDTPRDWDLPAPTTGARIEVSYQPIPVEALEALRKEASSQQIPEDTVRLVRALLAAAADPSDPLTITDLGHLLEEVRGFLLSEGQLHRLLELAHVLQSARPLDPELIDRELSRFTEPVALRRILHSMPPGASEAPAELLELLDLLPGDHLSSLLDILNEEGGVRTRAVERQLVSHQMRTRIDTVLARLGSAPPKVTIDLVSAVRAVRSDRDVELLQRLAHRAEPELLPTLRALIEAVRAEPLPMPLLIELLGSSVEDIRLHIIERVTKSGDRSAFTELNAHLDRCPTLTLREADILGRALAWLQPDRAAALFRPLIRPTGWMERLKGGVTVGAKHRQWAAISALGFLPLAEAEADIKWFSERAGQELHEHCNRVLHRRRREGIKNG